MDPRDGEQLLYEWNALADASSNVRIARSTNGNESSNDDNHGGRNEPPNGAMGSPTADDGGHRVACDPCRLRYKLSVESDRSVQHVADAIGCDEARNGFESHVRTDDAATEHLREASVAVA